MKATALAYSNIAFIKYWGKTDQELRLPTNNSISMNLSNLKTITTVEFSPRFNADSVTIDGQKKRNEINRVIAHLNRIRELKKSTLYARVVSRNNFPSSSGLSSSASAFAALTIAAAESLNLRLNQRQISSLARLASGSASRSVPAGFVEWHKGSTNQNSYAETIFPENYWPIIDIVAIVSFEKKAVTTTVAQKYAFSSPFFSVRIKNLPEKIKQLKTALTQKNFPRFAEIIESEALELHAVIMTQTPSYFYLFPETVSLFSKVRQWRNSGLPVYFTLNTGHDAHLLCQEENKEKLMKKLSSLPFVRRTIINNPAGPAKIINNHLF